MKRENIENQKSFFSNKLEQETKFNTQSRTYVTEFGRNKQGRIWMGSNADGKRQLQECADLSSKLTKNKLVRTKMRPKGGTKFFFKLFFKKF